MQRSTVRRLSTVVLALALHLTSAPAPAADSASQGGAGYDSLVKLFKVQLEQLLAERANQLGCDFDLKKFHDEFLATGVIPISLIRWEMTGKADQIETMR